MTRNNVFRTLMILLLFVNVAQPAIAAWPILSEKDMQKFIQTFPGMYREYKQLTMTINPQAGPEQKQKHDQEVSRILTENGWNWFFWPQLGNIVRCYSFVKQEQVNNAHGAGIEKFVSDLTAAPWMAPEHKKGLNDFFSQIKGNYQAEAEKIKREVHPNDLNLIRRNSGGLDSVLEQITQIEIEAALGKLAPASQPVPLPPPSGGKPNPMVHQRGPFIVDESGQAIKLRGTLMEGWVMWNGPLWGTGLNGETHIYKKIVALVGEAEAERFRQAVYENFFTEDDVKLMADMGFNVVRIPFNHTILEDDASPYVYKASGWQILDRALTWCKKYGIYAVLDLHSAPGGQGSVFVADPDPVKLWDSEENKNRTVALWKAIAARYRNNRTIAAYDLLNEPHAPSKDALVHFYQRITVAVREVDPYHMVVLEGGGLANDFSMYENLPAQPVENMAYSFHTYNFLSDSVDTQQVQAMKNLSIKHQTPMWNSEFGAHTTQWVRDTVNLFEKPGNQISGWIYWPWKRVGEQDSKRWAALMDIPHSPNWDKTRSWIGAPLGLFAAKPTREEALKGMCEFIQMSAAHNLIVNSGMAQALRITSAWTERQPDTLAQVQATCLHR